ncbi:F189B protein, partial [Leiothrix lutea]|nr:F189B protein [Leiothrix lutea]
MDSGSLIMSEIMDIPGDSSPSEDSCLLELQGSMRSVDYVLFRSIQRSRADYCLSVDCVRPEGSLCSQQISGKYFIPKHWRKPCPTPPLIQVRALGCTGIERGHGEGGFCSPLGIELTLLGLGQGGSMVGPLLLMGDGRQQDPGPVRIGLMGAMPCLRAGMGLSEQCPVSDDEDRTVRAVSCVCQSSVPCLMTRTGLSEQCLCLSEQCPVSDSPRSAGLCSEACLLHRSHCDSPPLLRASSVGKNKLPPCKKVPQQLSKTTTRSLGDLKGYRGTRGLVARFLQRPKRSLAAGTEVSGHSFHGHKQV